MTALYVYALTLSSVEPFAIGPARVEAVRVGDVYAVGERRADRGRVSEEALRQQHAIVEAIASRTDAVLPARFGSLVEIEELTALLRLRGDTIRSSLDLVRGREQMTLRFASPRADPTAPLDKPASGTEYLRARGAATGGKPLPPAALQAREAVADMIVAERTVWPAAYHLIKAGTATRYKDRLEPVRAARRADAFTVSGPWPAFAFAPELIG